MAMYFVMLLLNTILRDTKDTMLVNSVAGVSAIPILKSWVTIPSSVCFFFAYSRLQHARSVSPRAKFMILLFSFAAFYCVFALVGKSTRSEGAYLPLFHRVTVTNHSFEEPA
jgi:ATP/ADP translocase